MGRDIEIDHFKYYDFHRFDRLIDREMEILHERFQAGRFSSRRAIGGLELELWIVNEQGKSAGGLTAGGVKVEAVDEKADGTDGAFSYRFNATLKASGLTVPVEIILTGVLVKHSELQFTTIGIGDVFPTDVRTQLLKKAVDRLKAKGV